MSGKTARRLSGLGAALSALLAPASGHASPVEDKRIVAELDIAYQEAVKHNDAETIDRILHEDFALVRGNGTVLTRDDIIDAAKNGRVQYEIQDEIPGTQTVRVWGDTAVVTAKLWLKGADDGKPFDIKLWFSDTYVRTQEGWRYAFAQVSLPLPPDTPE